MEPSDGLTENESSTTLEDFLVISSSEPQYYLQRGFSVSGAHSSLAARTLIAFEQTVEIKSTADQIAEQLKNDYRNF